MLQSRREMFTTAGAAVALASVAPSAFAKWEPSERYPDPYVQVLDPAFNSLRLGLASVERLYHGTRWNEGPVYFGDCALPALERYPEQPHHALGRGDRPHQRLSQAVEQRERQHARPAGPARHLRARHAPHDTHRIRRRHHRARRQVRRQAAQFAERRGGEIRQLDLVHRSAIRHPRQLRRPHGDAGAADQCLPARQGGPADRRDRRHQPAERARLLARRIEALRGRGGGDAARDPRVRRDRQRHQARQQARRSSPPSRAARRTAFASTSRATCGAAGAWAMRSRTA